MKDVLDTCRRIARLVVDGSAKSVELQIKAAKGHSQSPRQAYERAMKVVKEPEEEQMNEIVAGAKDKKEVLFRVFCYTQQVAQEVRGRVITEYERPAALDRYARGSARRPPRKRGS